MCNYIIMCRSVAMEPLCEGDTIVDFETITDYSCMFRECKDDDDDTERKLVSIR